MKNRKIRGDIDNYCDRDTVRKALSDGFSIIVFIKRRNTGFKNPFDIGFAFKGKNNIVRISYRICGEVITRDLPLLLYGDYIGANFTKECWTRELCDVVKVFDS